MKKKFFCISVSLIFLLGSCGGINSQIDDYENALKDKNLPKAAKVLTKLSGEKLDSQQKERIIEIHNEYFEGAIDNVIDKYEKYLEEGKTEKACKEIEGLQDDQLTFSQASRITEISVKYAADEMSKYQEVMEDAFDIFDSF